MPSRYSAAQLAGLAGAYGLSNPGAKNYSEGLAQMVAIALAESRGNPNAISVTGDYGLWQINKASWPELFTQFRWNSPDQNAAMAKHVLDAQGVTAWSTYTTSDPLRSYKQYMGVARRAVASHATDGGNPAPEPNPDDGLPPDAAGGTTVHSGMSLWDIYSTSGGEIFHSSALYAIVRILTNPIVWARLGCIIGGGALLALGGVMIVKQTTVNSAANALGKGIAKGIPQQANHDSDEGGDNGGND